MSGCLPHATNGLLDQRHPFGATGSNLNSVDSRWEIRLRISFHLDPCNYFLFLTYSVSFEVSERAHHRQKTVSNQ